jgi:hypothetical protein
MIEKLIAEAKLSTAIVAELVLGFITWLLVLGFVPSDGVDFDVIGSMALIVALSIPYWVAHRYVKAYQAKQH